VDLDTVRWEFSGALISWRGPSPYHFIAVPDDVAADLRALAPMLTYGWGVIPVTVRIGESTFTTSLFPRQGGYLVPIKDAIRRVEDLTLGDAVAVEMAVQLV